MFKNRYTGGVEPPTNYRSNHSTIRPYVYRVFLYNILIRCVVTPKRLMITTAGHVLGYQNSQTLVLRSRDLK